MSENTRTNTENYDIQGMGVGRLLRAHLRATLTPLWSYGSELQFTHILGLFLRHRFGYGFAYFTTRYERQWLKLLTTWRSVSRRLRRPPSE